MFDELEERFGELLARLRHDPTPLAPPGSGRIIREVLDPGFLKQQLDVIRQRGGERPGGNRLPLEAYQAAYGAIGEAAQQAPYVPFISRDASASNLQSVLTTCIESRCQDTLKAAPEGVDRLAHAVLGDVEIFRQFGPCDPRWMETKLAEVWAEIDGRPSFPDTPAAPLTLAPQARVILLSDWGTALPGAVAVAEQIRERIEQVRNRQQHVIHLGDVYYSGWQEEYETRFLRYWPVERSEQEVMCWSLNGNHDMYSGGHGYFGYLLHDPRFRGHWLQGHPRQTPSSHFSLENEHWQILGLDSAYVDHDLAGSQAQWVAGKLSDTRKTMLLTHHQPFSAYEAVSQKMTKTLLGALEEGTVLDAWFWGHEHRCGVYGKDEGRPEGPVPWLRFGSCIGNGGVPQLLPDPELAEGERELEGYAPLSWAYDGAAVADGNDWLGFGFVVLDFDAEQIAVEFVDEQGNVVNQLVLPEG